MIHKKTFTNSDLNVDYEFNYTHNLNTQDVIPSWKDENGVFRIVGDAFKVVDDNSIVLYCNNEVTGNQTLYLEYNAAGATSGKRAFEQNTSDNPDLNFRFILGKANTPEINMTLTDFLVWIFGKLNFLKKASNLSDLPDKAASRGNLQVYSTSEVDASLAVKASLYQNASGYALGTANTAVYIPFDNYHPATKKYVDDTAIQPLYKGLAVIGDMTGGLQTTVINFADIGTSNYHVLGTFKENGIGLTSVPIWKTRNHANDSFNLDYAEAGSGTNNFTFYFYVIAN